MAKKKKKTEIILTPEQQQEADYQRAVRRMEGAEKMLQAEDKVHMYREAIRMFQQLGEYEDSQVRKKRCSACRWHARHTGKKYTRKACG